MMSSAILTERIDAPIRRIDPVMAALLFVMVVIGLGVLWTASWFRAEQLYGEPLRFFMRQGLWVVVGLAAMMIAMFTPLSFVRRLLPLLMLAAILLMVLTFIPGVSARYMGARRWIVLFNVSFQPSELAKLVLILYLAHIFARREGNFNDPIHTLVPPAIVAILFAGIVLLQNDFSTAIFIVALTLILFFVAGVPISWFIRMFVVLLPPTALILFSREHRVLRIIAYLRPEADPAGSGFQVLAARRALEGGGFWGTGVGRGVRKLGGLPEAQSDFLFAVLGEELGFLGVVLVLGLFLAFTLRGIYLAGRTKDWFKSLLIFGVTISIALQAFLNIAVVAGAVPATGVPLPFFSSGGSSLVITFVMVGLLLNAASPEAGRV